MERIEMSGKALERLEVLRQVLDGAVGQKAATERLGLTDRQVRRLLRRYEVEDTAGLVDPPWRPAALYGDRHGIFTKHDLEDEAPTQFQRTLATLGIAGIQAAKGRVERLFQTLQDRLVKATRLAGISDMASTNVFLETYLASTMPALR